MHHKNVARDALPHKRRHTDLSTRRRKNVTALALEDAQYRRLMDFSPAHECVLWKQLSL